MLLKRYDVVEFLNALRSAISLFLILQVFSGVDGTKSAYFYVHDFCY